MAELKNGEFGVDMEKEKILWTDRKRHTIALREKKATTIKSAHTPPMAHMP